MIKRVLKDLPMVELAEVILLEEKTPMKIYDIIDKVAKIKEIDEADDKRLLQLYMDITLSAKFVFVGNDEWVLKEGNLEFWDRDGFYFITPEEKALANQADEVEEEIVEEEIALEEYETPVSPDDVDDEDEDDEELDEDEKEEKNYIDVGLELKTTDEDDGKDISFDEDDYDEDDYNEIMDDYEDMYDN